MCTVMLYGMDAPGDTEPEPVVLEIERSAEGVAARLGLAAANTSAVMTKNPVRKRRAPLAAIISALLAAFAAPSHHGVS